VALLFLVRVSVARRSSSSPSQTTVEIPRRCWCSSPTTVENYSKGPPPTERRIFLPQLVFFTTYHYMGQIFSCEIPKKAPCHAVVGVLHQQLLRTTPKLHHTPNDDFFLAVFAVLNTCRQMAQIFRCKIPKKAPCHAVVGVLHQRLLRTTPKLHHTPNDEFSCPSWCSSPTTSTWARYSGARF
jgi:hypothetical protein